MSKQYLPKKPTQWGFKAFSTCDADTGILLNLELYTGQHGGGGDGDGLPQDVVLRLTEGLENQANIFFTDDFYTSRALATAVSQIGMHLVGTLQTNRRGFPPDIKADTKQFEKQAERGAMRYVRDGGILFQQWKDRRVVTMLSTVHRGNESVQVTRNTKVRATCPATDSPPQNCPGLQQEDGGGGGGSGQLRSVSCGVSHSSPDQEVLDQHFSRHD